MYYLIHSIYCIAMMKLKVGLHVRHKRTCTIRPELPWSLASLNFKVLFLSKMCCACCSTPLCRMMHVHSLTLEGCYSCSFAEERASVSLLILNLTLKCVTTGYNRHDGVTSQPTLEANHSPVSNLYKCDVGTGDLQ